MHYVWQRGEISCLRLFRTSQGQRSSAPPPNPDSDSLTAETGTVHDTREPQTLVVEEDGDDNNDDDSEEDETSSMDDEDLPRWAKRSAFPDDPLMRSHTLLVALVPAYLLPDLPGPQDRAKLLNVLLSGQLLCIAYNIGIRQSRKPWGYINVDSIHDIFSLEAAVTKSEADGTQGERGAQRLDVQAY